MPAGNEILEFILDKDFEGMKRLITQFVSNHMVNGTEVPKIEITYTVDVNQSLVDMVGKAEIRVVSDD
jgi:hypothetical protein